MKLRLSLICLVPVTVLAISLVSFYYGQQEKARKYEQKILNFFGQPAGPAEKDAVERQLWLAKYSNQVLSLDYTPVHIVRRSGQAFPWMFVGTGTLLTRQPNVLLTAWHVLQSETPAEFGYRFIGPEEWAGLAVVRPIVEVMPMGDLGDAVTCTISDGADFPALALPPRPSRSAMELAGRFQIGICPPDLTVTLLTEPERQIRCLFFFKTVDDKLEVVFDFDAQPGESGTGAVIRGGGDVDQFLVVTRHHQFEGEALQSVGLPLDKPRNLGVGHLIQIRYSTTAPGKG